MVSFLFLNCWLSVAHPSALLVSVPGWKTPRRPTDPPSPPSRFGICRNASRVGEYCCVMKCMCVGAYVRAGTMCVRACVCVRAGVRAWMRACVTEVVETVIFVDA